MENPFAPPQADLAAPAPDAAAPHMPWEDRAAFPTLGARVIATLQWLVRRPAELGPALAAPTDVVPPIGFFALLALPLTLAIALLGILSPVQPFWQAWMAGLILRSEAVLSMKRSRRVEAFALAA